MVDAIRPAKRIAAMPARPTSGLTDQEVVENEQEDEDVVERERPLQRIVIGTAVIDHPPRPAAVA